MAKLRWGSLGDPDFEAMDEQEYEETEDYPEYTGPMPPKNTLLNGVIKKVWATESSKGSAMLKVFFEATGNSGEKKKYDGLPVWDNVVLVPQAKFHWQTFLDALGLTLKVMKAKTVISDEDESAGTPVTQIGKVKFPAKVSIISGKEKYEGEFQARVTKYVPYVGADDVDEEDEEDDDDDDPPF